MTKEEQEKLVEEVKAKTEKIKASLQHSTDMLEITNLMSLYTHLIGVDFSRIHPDYWAQEDPRARTEVCEGGVMTQKDRSPVGPAGRVAHEGQGSEDKPRKGMGTGVLGLNPTGVGYIKISEDGKEAKAMWDQFEFHTMVNNPYPGDERKQVQYWFMGRYNNEFVKENGRWRCLSHQVLAYFRTAFEQGWLKQPDCRTGSFWGKNKPASTLLALEVPYTPSKTFYAQPAPEPEDSNF